jgi:flagellar biosynthesis/type III secretory pathway protein FliH
MCNNTLEELLEEVEDDITIALLVNPDRVEIIKKAAQEVIDLRFNDERELELIEVKED